MSRAKVTWLAAGTIRKIRSSQCKKRDNIQDFKTALFTRGEQASAFDGSRTITSNIE